MGDEQEILSLTEKEVLESGDYFFSEDVAFQMNRDVRTVYRWNKIKKLVAKYVLFNGRRVYTRQQLEDFTRVKKVY